MTTDAESRPFNAVSFYAFLKEGRFMECAAGRTATFMQKRGRSIR